MSWIDSLSKADVAELAEMGTRLGPERFERYLFIAITILVFGPIECAPQTDVVDPEWDALICERDGFLHLNTDASP
jgi:hypothetical protein